MKKDIHPSNYRKVVFKDMSNEETFIVHSTVAAKETIEIDGETYPLVKLEITSSSHPFFTGKQKLVDTAGRVDKFRSRYGDRKKNCFRFRNSRYQAECPLQALRFFCRSGKFL